MTFGDKVKVFDIFGSSVSFNVKGNSTHRTYMGAVLSLIMIGITLTYAFKQLSVMTSYGDTAHQSTLEEQQLT